MNFAKMFLPVMQEGPSVQLPGLAPDPGGTVPLMPLEMTPIPASGQYTGLPFPLSEPLPMPPVPASMEVMSSSLPEDALAAGIPRLEVTFPEPPEFPLIPPSPDAPMPGMDALYRPLPTATSLVQEPGPPQTEALEGPSLPSPTPSGGFASVTMPEMEPLPQPTIFVPALEVPTLPAPAVAEPVLGAAPENVQPNGGAVAADQQKSAATFAEERSRLKAPLPDWASGKIVWEQIWGDA